jgi:hypothetical protein
VHTFWGMCFAKLGWGWVDLGSGSDSGLRQLNSN